MARIAGHVAREGGASRAAEKMLSGAATASGSPLDVRASGACSLGIAGHGAGEGIAVVRDVAVAFDGVLYNREDLPSAGSDAECVAELYTRFGLPDALKRVNGDFALALYDAATSTLWLARDHFGVKPLYFARGADGVAFGSSPGLLLRLPWISPEVNRTFVALFAGSHYRTFDNDPQASPFRAIEQCPGGHCLRVRGGEVQRVAYFALTEQAELDGAAEEELAEQYRALLLDAVGRRLRRAERPGFTLSGGMDSSSVLACAVEAAGTPQIAYSSVYSDATYDESGDIQPMLEKVSQWRQVKIEPADLVDVVTRMVKANEEPVATATWLSHYLLCEQVQRDGVRDLFGGLGGDELNAGEYEYFPYFFADLERAGAGAQLDEEIARWVEHHDHPIFRKSRATVDAAFTRLVDLARPGVCRPDRARLLRYGPAVSRDYFDLAAFEPVMDHPFSSYLKNRTYQDIVRETAPCCLRASDRHANAFGLQTFWPFLDVRLAEFMFRVPGTSKIRGGVTKHLLRAAMRGILPEETRTRVKKTGWNAPAHLWFTGKGADLVRDIVGSRRFRERGIYDADRVLALLADHEDVVASNKVAENHMMFFWQLLNLEIWLDWVDTLSSAPPGARAADR